TIEKGEVKIGVGGGGAALFLQDMGVNPGLEGQVFVDIGLGDDMELRVRTVGEYGFDVEGGRGMDSFSVQGGALLKIANNEQTESFIIGLDIMGYWFYDRKSKQEDKRTSGALPWLTIGGVFSPGEPGTLRWVFGVMINTLIYPSAYAGNLQGFLGLDIPINSRVSLRPELSADLMVPTLNGIVGAGMAVVFR
ncbi:MAG: hypothetical protein WC889_05150, partial [Myxococcota bacterium]